MSIIFTSNLIPKTDFPLTDAQYLSYFNNVKGTYVKLSDYLDSLNYQAGQGVSIDTVDDKTSISVKVGEGLKINSDNQLSIDIENESLTNPTSQIPSVSLVASALADISSTSINLVEGNNISISTDSSSGTTSTVISCTSKEPAPQHILYLDSLPVTLSAASALSIPILEGSIAYYNGSYFQATLSDDSITWNQIQSSVIDVTETTTVTINGEIHNVPTKVTINGIPYVLPQYTTDETLKISDSNEISAPLLENKADSRVSINYCDTPLSVSISDNVSAVGKFTYTDSGTIITYTSAVTSGSVTTNRYYLTGIAAFSASSTVKEQFGKYIFTVKFINESYEFTSTDNGITYTCATVLSHDSFYYLSTSTSAAVNPLLSAPNDTDVSSISFNIPASVGSQEAINQFNNLSINKIGTVLCRTSKVSFAVTDYSIDHNTTGALILTINSEDIEAYMKSYCLRTLYFSFTSSSGIIAYKTTIKDYYGTNVPYEYNLINVATGSVEGTLKYTWSNYFEFETTNDILQNSTEFSKISMWSSLYADEFATSHVPVDACIYSDRYAAYLIENLISTVKSLESRVSALEK